MASTISAGTTTTTALVYSADTSGVLQLQTNGTTTAITVDTSQNVGLGVTPSAKLDVYQAYSSDTASQQRFRDSTGVSLNFGGTSGGKKFLQAQDSTGSATYYDILINPLGGNLLVGTTTTSPISGGNTTGVTISKDLSGNYGETINSSSATGTQYFMVFGRNGSLCGNITSVATNSTTYGVTSDYRLKNVIGSVTGFGERIDALKPIDYQWKEDNSQARGFLAHEFQSVYFNSVSGTKDAVDSDGNPIYQSMQASTTEVIADLVAEIQSLRKRLATLEAKG